MLIPPASDIGALSGNEWIDSVWIGRDEGIFWDVRLLVRWDQHRLVRGDCVDGFLEGFQSPWLKIAPDRTEHDSECHREAAIGSRSVHQRFVSFNEA